MIDDRISLEQQTMYNISWAACDEHGCVGIFESGGYAPIPESILRSDSARKKVLDFLENLPVTTTSIFHRDILSKILLDEDDEEEDLTYPACEELGRRGVFYYGVIDDLRRMEPYERIMSPVTPLHISALPDDIHDLIESTKMKVSFSNSQQVPIDIAEEM